MKKNYVIVAAGLGLAQLALLHATAAHAQDTTAGAQQCSGHRYTFTKKTIGNWQGGYHYFCRPDQSLARENPYLNY